MIDNYKKYSEYTDEELNTQTRKFIVMNLLQWRKDNIERFLYKNGIELLDEVIEMISEGKV